MKDEYNDNVALWLLGVPVAIMGSFIIHYMVTYDFPESAPVVPQYHKKYTKHKLSKVLNYADKNQDGSLEFDEQVECWKRMGYKGPFIRSKGSKAFLKPNISRLEEAIRSYENKKQ